MAVPVFTKRTRAQQRAYEAELEAFEYKPMRPPPEKRRREGPPVVVIIDEDGEREQTDEPTAAPAQIKAEVQEEPPPDDPPAKRKKKRTDRTAAVLERIERAEAEKSHLQQTLEQKQAEIAELKAAVERTAAANSWLEAETSRLRKVVQRKQERTAALKDAVGELKAANDEQAARIAELERGAAGFVFRATVIREENANLPPAAAEKRAKKLAQWTRLKARSRKQAISFVYFDYKHVQMTAPIEWWRQSERPAVLLLRVENTREWEERPPVDLADCVHVARRLPTGAWWSGGAFQSADLVLYAKPRPESAALAAALVRDFQAAANLTDFLQAVAISPPTDDSRALLLAPYREYLRFHEFAAQNPRSVSNYYL